MAAEVYAQDYVQEHALINVKVVQDVVMVVPLVLEDVVEIVNLDALEHVLEGVDLDARMDVDLDVLRLVEEIVLDVRNPVLADAPIHVLETVLMDVPIHAIQRAHLVKVVLEVALDVQVVVPLDALDVPVDVVVVADLVVADVQMLIQMGLDVICNRIGGIYYG